MRYVRAALTGCYIACAPSGFALDVGFTVGLESEHTSNTARTAMNEIEEWIHKPGFDFQAEHEGPNLTLEAGYSFERRLYQEDLYDDENATTGRAELVWRALPERLDFTVRNSRTESPIDAIESTTPLNRQVTTNTEAGPTLRFRTRGEDELQFEYLYGHRAVEETAGDADSQTATARYNLVIATTNIVRFELINDQTDFDEQLIPDLEANIGQITWERTSTTVDFSLTGGYNSTERDGNLEDVDGAIYDLSIDWQARPTTSVLLAAGRAITDQSDTLSVGSLDFGESLGATNSGLTDVFISERREIALTQVLGRTTASLALFNDGQDYEDALRDNENTGATLSLERRLSPQMNLRFSATQRTQDFSDEREEIDETRAELLLSRELGRRLALSIGVRYEEREGDDTARSGSNYDEWTGFVRLDYDVVEPPP